MKQSDKYEVIWIAIAILIVFLLAIATKGESATFKDEWPVPPSQIIWDHGNISGWKVTGDLSSVYIEKDFLYMWNSKRCDWPLLEGEPVNANSWVIHKRESDGRWHANTWDFMRQCQERKDAEAVGAPDGWGPSHGEEIYIFLSGIARPGYNQTVQERTNVVKYYWEIGEGVPPDECIGFSYPIIRSFEANPEEVLRGTGGIKDGYNVELTWEVENTETVLLEASDGRSAETLNSVVNGINVLITEPTNFTLTARNKCTPVEGYPSKTVYTRMFGPILTGVNYLLLNED